MMSAKLTRTLALAAGTAAVVGLGTLTACSPNEKPSENSQTSTATVSPTEKGVPGALTPGAHAGARNSFTPTAKVSPVAPTVLPGNTGTGG